MPANGISPFLGYYKLYLIDIFDFFVNIFI